VLCCRVRISHLATSENAVGGSDSVLMNENDASYSD
jgi:hypothetical protein